MSTNAVPKQLLSKLLRRMSQVIPNNSPKEVLTKIKLVFTGDMIRLYGTDLEQFLSVSALCQTDEPGMALVPYADFRSMFSKLTGDDISLALEGGVVRIGDDNCTFELQSHTNIEEYPTFTEFEVAHRFKLPVRMLCQCFGQLVHCTDKESTRYALNAINLVGSHGGLEMQATDGRRVALLAVPGVACQEFSALVPAHVARSMNVIVDGEHCDCEVRIGESSVGVETDGMSYSCRQIEGRFPSSTSFKTALKSLQWNKADANNIRALATQAMAATTREERGIVLEFNGQTLNARSQTTKAKFDSRVKCEGSNHGSITINSEYLYDAVADCEQLKIGIAGDMLAIERDDLASELIMGMSK